MFEFADLEIFDRLDPELQSGVLVANEECPRVLLESGHCPHVVDALLDGLVQGKRLVRARYQNHHLKRG